MGKITIVIPAYNCEKYIEKCVESVLSQTMQDLEVILVDDGSTDATPDICQRYKEKDERVIYLRQKNQGVSAARNLGLQNASSEYVMFVDSDDSIREEMCEKLFGAMDESTDLAICGFERRFYHEEQIKTAKNVLPDCQDIYTRKDLGQVFGRLYETTILTSSWAKLYRKNLLDKMTQWFPRKINLGEDVLFNLEYLKNCNKIAVVNEPYYIYNHHSRNKSLTKRPSKERMQISSLLLGSAEKFAKEEGIYEQVKEKLWKVYYKDQLNYLEQFPIKERGAEAELVLQSEMLHRVLKEENSKQPDMWIYHFFLGSNRVMLSMFAELRRAVKRAVRGN